MIEYNLKLRPNDWGLNEDELWGLTTKPDEEEPTKCGLFVGGKGFY